MQFSLKIHVAFALVSHGTSQDPSGNQTKPIPSRHGPPVTNTPEAKLMRGIVRTPSRLPETPPAQHVPFSRPRVLALWAVVPRDENLGNGQIRGAHDLGNHSEFGSRSSRLERSSWSGEITWWANLGLRLRPSRTLLGSERSPPTLSVDGFCRLK